MALVFVLAGAFATRLRRATRQGVELEPLQETLDLLERSAQTGSERKILEALRERVNQVAGQAETSSGERAQAQVTRAERVDDLLKRKLRENGWEVTEQPDGVVDLTATKGDETLLIETKASRDALAWPVLDQLRRARGHAEDARIALAVGAGRGQPTLIERDAEGDGFLILRVNIDTDRVTGIPD